MLLLLLLLPPAAAAATVAVAWSCPQPNSSGCPQEIDLVEQYRASEPPNATSMGQGNTHPFTGGRLVGTPCQKEKSFSQ